ncbi:endonuclease/exonuclease/phosphatase family protein [Leeia oryzae]|uniref:endonuclease/exonuclease/phosphatase family protein n=1 Tax=Leeia oryzae TaxID=356662 RepID=UPI00037952FC|nr:endonuclease/exonuclease/phosphatase family protein [Leeia oryzae]
MTDHISVLSLNMHKGMTPLNRRLTVHQLGDMLQQHNSDIVFLQEVQGLHHRRASKFENWPAAGHAAYLAECLAKEGIYGGNAFYPYGHHGNALICGFRLISWRNIDISENRLEKRGMLHCVYELPVSKIRLHAICVHLNLLAHDRRKQVARLVEEIQHHVPSGEPLIMAGDFNDWRNEASYVLSHDLGLTEVFQHLHGHLARSFPARWPLLPLDRIYVKHVKIEQASVGKDKLWARLSDHLPLMAKVNVQKGQQTAKS